MVPWDMIVKLLWFVGWPAGVTVWCLFSLGQNRWAPFLWWGGIFLVSNLWIKSTVIVFYTIWATYQWVDSKSKRMKKHDAK